MPVSANHRWEWVPTVDNKAGKTYGPGAVTLKGRRRYEGMVKKNPHAAIMPQVDVKINISVQIIAHKLVYGFVLILWLLMAAWPS